MSLVTQQVVPHGFIAIVRDRERHARQGIFQGYAPLEGLGTHRVPGSVVEQPLWQRHGAMGREDIHTEAGVALEQLLGDNGQFVGMRGGVLAVNHQARRFTGERIGAHRAALLVAGRWRGQAAAVGRDAAVGVAGLFGTDAGQGGTELGGLVWRYGRMGSTGHGQHQGGGQ
ncbi:hypothetical protein D3C85_1087490 [compost metagenome]